MIFLDWVLPRGFSLWILPVAGAIGGEVFFIAGILEMGLFPSAPVESVGFWKSQLCPRAFTLPFGL